MLRATQRKVVWTRGSACARRIGAGYTSGPALGTQRHIGRGIYSA